MGTAPGVRRVCPKPKRTAALNPDPPYYRVPFYAVLHRAHQVELTRLESSVALKMAALNGGTHCRTTFENVSLPTSPLTKILSRLSAIEVKFWGGIVAS